MNILDQAQCTTNLRKIKMSRREAVLSPSYPSPNALAILSGFMLTTTFISCTHLDK